MSALMLLHLIFDVNGRSRPDLVVGKFDGTPITYWNFGTLPLRNSAF